MKIVYFFNKSQIVKFILLYALGTTIYATEPDSPFFIDNYPHSYSHLKTKVNSPPQILLIEIESEDLDDERKLELKPNAFYSINLGGVSIENEKILRIKDIGSYIYKLSLFEANLDNELMKTLPLFLNLKILDISNNYFDDTGMQYLIKFPNLMELNIVYNKITHLGLQPLLSLPRLRVLDAGCTYIGNDGIKIISQSESITSLNVRACGIDDKALPYLKSMSFLKKVVLSNNKFSCKAKEQLIESKRPDLEIEF